jgi:hypothetical protein
MTGIEFPVFTPKSFWYFQTTMFKKKVSYGMRHHHWPVFEDELLLPSGKISKLCGKLDAFDYLD